MIRAGLLTVAVATSSAMAQVRPTIVSSELIADPSPTASVHASTIVETPSGLVAAWFGGSREGAHDVGIWLSRRRDGRWSVPVEVANGREPDGRRNACYNPVLFRTPDGVLHLFYKVGPQPARWWGTAKASLDDGRTWSAASRLPDGVLGPIKDKPVLVGGVLVSPSSTESVDDPPRWRVHFEISRDNAVTWAERRPAPGVDSAGKAIEAIQPTILVHENGVLQALGRTRSGRLFETWSRDTGTTWTPLRLTSIPNPNSGVDALTLRTGQSLLVYNNTTSGRTPLSVAVSSDGVAFEPVLTLESGPGEFSYPAVIQTRDGLVHITYTVQRGWIKHVTLRLAGVD